MDKHRDGVTLMNQALTHRGPDDWGEFDEPHFKMAMRRLAIIDPEGGRQPLFAEDRSIVLMANAEIYNYIELKAMLEAKGHCFSTRSDCETIIHLYEEFGVDFVQHLRGMFAIALWDGSSRTLVLARDRMGEKPLYLRRQDNYLLFASEIKALIKAPFTMPSLDPYAVDLYFHYGFVPEPYTILQGVVKLPAGFLMTVNPDSWEIQQHPYWDMLWAHPLDGDPATHIAAELDTISSLILRSDVPVGIALSGGLDSSAIAVLTAGKYLGKLHAFSVGYPGSPSNDERSEAAALARFLNMPFHDVELTTADVVRSFPDLIYHTDDPIPDIAGFCYYAVCKLAREHHVPVLLLGHGGDELFWGYQWVAKAAQDTILKNELRDHSSPLSRKAHLVLSSLFQRPPHPIAYASWIDWFLTELREDVALGYARWKRINGSHHDRVVFMDSRPDFRLAERWKQEDLYHSSFERQLGERNPYELFSLQPPWENIPCIMTRLISQTYLLGNCITQGDRLSMASSVEMRLPLVDYRLIEIVLGHRKRHPDHHLPAKQWLREALRGMLPEWVLNRPKRGFSPPTRAWYEALHREYGNTLDDGYLVQSKILSPDAGRKLGKGYGLREGIKVMPFKALCLETWCRKFLCFQS
jgi:asparagine synthase (glutamine-hydrolysing)